LIWNNYAINKKINVVLEKGNIKDFKDILIHQSEKNKELESELKRAFDKIDELKKISQITIQKVGIVRFNPFNDLGGKQSFVIAMLDDKNNGFVLSSIFVKEGSRVYAKAIKNLKSKYTLSGEEQNALEKATKKDTKQDE